MGQISLTPEEIEDCIVKYGGFRDVAKAAAKTQLKKVVEWGNEDCKEHGQLVQDGKYPIVKIIKRRRCPQCWQALLEELEERKEAKHDSL